MWLPSTRLMRHHAGGTLGMSEPPPLRTGRAPWLVSFSVCMSGCGGSQASRQRTCGRGQWRRPQQGCPGSPYRCVAGGPGRPPAPGGRTCPRGQGQPLTVRASPCLSRAQSGRSFPQFPPGNRRVRTRTTEHSRGLSLAGSAVSGAHKEVGELGSRVLPQSHQHVGSDAGQPRSGPGPSFLTHPPSPSAWTGRPDVLHLWTRTSWSTTGPSTHALGSEHLRPGRRLVPAHTPSGQNTSILVDIGPSPGPIGAVAPEVEASPPQRPLNTSLAPTSSLPLGPPPPARTQ